METVSEKRGQHVDVALSRMYQKLTVCARAWFNPREHPMDFLQLLNGNIVEFVLLKIIIK